MKKLSQQQQRRIRSRQTKAITQINPELPQHQGLVIANLGSQIVIESDNHQEQFNCHFRKNLGNISAGDLVNWQLSDPANHEGVITALLPRKSALERPSRLSKKPKTIAANIDQIFIVIALEPDPVGHYIDRYLVAAHHQDITPTLLFNKIDLLNSDNQSRYHQLTERYQNLGYRVIGLSAFELDKAEILPELLNNHTSVFVGQSGVGKSEIIQSLLPQEEIKTGQISEQNLRGKHTTTTARLYRLPKGGKLIDSPGIREFGLWDLPRDVIFNGFKEFETYLGQCKFRDCNHLESTPGCALVEALSTSKIHPQRYKNYHRIMQELSE